MNYFVTSLPLWMNIRDARCVRSSLTLSEPIKGTYSFYLAIFIGDRQFHFKYKFRSCHKGIESHNRLLILLKNRSVCGNYRHERMNKVELLSFRIKEMLLRICSI